MNKRLVLWVLLLLALKTSAHAGVPDFDHYPRREADRPWVIPSHLGEIRTGASALFTPNAVGSALYLSALNLLLSYESGNSEQFSWFLNPFPLGFKYQILRDENQRIGLRAYYSIIAYGVLINYRYFIASQAVELEANADGTNLLLSEDKSEDLTLRLILQASDRVAIKPYTRFARVHHGNRNAARLIKGYATEDDPLSWHSLSNWVFGVDLQFAIHPKLDLEVGFASHYFLRESESLHGVSGAASVRIRF